MGRKVENPLTDTKLRGRLEPGLYGDGGGLYLQVKSDDARSWVFRYRIKGHLSATGKPVSREMGLGSFAKVPLKTARELAAENRRLIGQGIDPLARRREQEQAKERDTARAVTFTQAAERYIETHKAGWKNAKHIQQWENSLATYAQPFIGSMAVKDIGTDDVLKVLDPIWTTKTETATRLRGRIELILDWSKTRGFREGENPARWRGHLQNALAKPSRVRRVVHHAALPYTALPAFIESVSLLGGVASKSLIFTILTAARTGEVIRSKFAEMNLEERVWTVPASRMKAGKEHRVPLSDRAVAIVRELQELDQGEYVFAGMRRGTHISDMSMLKVLERLDQTEVTVHGFRSTFRDWAAEKTSYPNHVVEMALAHAIGDEVEAAYRRGDLFEKRRALMDEWEAYCLSAGGADV